jgi:hypothetical protein
VQRRGRWRLREPQEALELSKAEVWQKARHGALIASRARVADRGEWRLSPAKDADRSSGHPMGAARQIGASSEPTSMP